MFSDSNGSNEDAFLESQIKNDSISTRRSRKAIQKHLPQSNWIPFLADVPWWLPSTEADFSNPSRWCAFVISNALAEPVM